MNHLLTFCLLSTLPVLDLSAAQPSRPDIIIIMADDMGWSDIGCFGGEIETPTLDQLASNGVRLRQFYNTARCCPTRASLLTGLYAHQAGVGHMVSDRGSAGYRGELSATTATIAEHLSASGYRTYMSGKWHVTDNLGQAKQRIEPKKRTNWPIDRGFHHFFGTIHGGGSYYDPVSLTRGEHYLPAPQGDYHYTDAISEEAAKFIEQHADQSPDDPLFMYVSYTAPHWPLHARPADIERVKGRYQDGWDAMREARLKRQRDLGLIDEAWDLSPRDSRIQSWEQTADHPWQERRMEVYAAQVEQLDRGIGRIVAELTAQGRLENTLLLFLADNGGCAEEITAGWKSLTIPEKTRDGRDVKNGNNPKMLPGPEVTYQSYGLPWANASNTPFLLYKHDVHEGGISSPLIAHWPAGLEGKGVILDGPGHVIDLVSTCLDAAKATAITELKGIVMQPLEGVSLLPVLAGQPATERPIFWEHEGHRAVRLGRWKLVARHNRPWQLFDMVADRTEFHDLAGQKPQLVEALKSSYQQWAQRAQVRRWPLNR
ncbi:MAG: arylsulfatase [Planctomycetota bacterium]|nr:arylsulfatase [Planctomycetota bacterium]